MTLVRMVQLQGGGRTTPQSLSSTNGSLMFGDLSTGQAGAMAALA